MIRKSSGIALYVCLAAFSQTAAVAGEMLLTLDPETSEASFTLDSTLHEVHGRLFFRAGSIRFDPATGAASGEVIIDARRTDTANAKRDKKMHSKVLESEKYPEIVFRPSVIAGSIAERGTSEFRLDGTMTILGESHEVTLEASAEFSEGQVQATTSLSVPFVDWGMRDPSFLVLRVAKVVEVSLTIRGTMKDHVVDAEGGIR